MTIVKVKAPGHFASFCVAIDEPFCYLNGAFYLLRWSDAEAAKIYCADGVIPRDIEKMEFTEVEVETANDRNLITFK